MSLAIGTQLGSYEITGTLGAGGMGEVYRARDTKLGRDVAIKTLPASLADDKDRLARFEREAKLLASLNHGHIASVYGLDEQDGTLYIAMELVEGESLEQKLRRGALPVDDALHYGLQIAEALEAAHDKGVVHRDLKPANVMVTHDGQVKVLDFGLAKAFASDPNEAAVANSPALSVAMTQAGLILGTAAYMSPEQASGQPADQRADIWAFGVVLYEMLTGLPLYSGESAPHILAEVLKTEPDWNRLPQKLNPRVRQTLERCLRKKARMRYHSIPDVRVDIEEALSDPEGAAVSAGRDSAPAVLPRIAASIVITAALATLVSWLLWPAPAAGPLNRFEIQLPEGQAFRGDARKFMTLSPDGRRIVYNTSDGLRLRNMGELQAQLIPGTSDALTNPFFSADSQSIGYFQNNQIRRLAIGGGASTVIADARGIAGASWEPDGTILFAEGGGIYRVSATGGVPERVIDGRDNREAFFAPTLLPDGDSVLFTVTSAGTGWNEASIAVESLTTGERKLLVERGGDGVYLPTGHLVYALDDRLLGIAFDADSLTTSGGPVPLVEGVRRAPEALSAAANFAVADDGTLAYVSGESFSSSGPAQPVLVDRDGTESLLGAACACLEVSLSPDGMSVATTVISGANAEIWVRSIPRQTERRVTFETGATISPVWSPDSRRVAYTPFSNDGDGNRSRGIFSRAADGVGNPELLVGPELAGAVPSHWFADNRLLFATHSLPGESADDSDIGLVDLGADGAARILLDQPFNERRPALSPDGRWLAFESDESGEFEIYVRPFPDVDTRQWQVSSGGGQQARWSEDGSTLFYLSLTGDSRSLMETAVAATEETFSSELPRAVLDFDAYSTPVFHRHYSVAPDGDRFVVIAPTARRGDIVIVQNWTEELKRLVPVE